ncbi:MAG: hypothetical protein U9N41_05405 [Euryarchaeota archaeon]|nr:hypothetical protein [Euryarchaeota archaeon]
MQLLYFRRQPRLAHRSPPRSFFYKCILQGAIDFAEAAEGGVGATVAFCVAECRKRSAKRSCVAVAEQRT